MLEFLLLLHILKIYELLQQDLTFWYNAQKKCIYIIHMFKDLFTNIPINFKINTLLHYSKHIYFVLIYIFYFFY